ncbi:LysE family translocator [Aliamphritea ceti]|uniref:LysE family translocator n=1 Tax=Aliamphritea ceti TaxID=1524258 RepID=UPI0021C37017|nr:LysE family translocator [Aliamphritea ceti]
MNTDTLMMYLLISFFYVISPGPAILLAIFNSISHGMRAVMIGALGNITGLFVLSLVSVGGLGAILMASTTLFMLVKVLGASYLIYLGVRQLFSRKRQLKLQEEGGAETEQRAWFSHYREGLFLAVTNPKPILFFGALFPQFIDLNYALAPQFSVMTGAFMLFSFISLSCYGLLAQSAKGFLTGSQGMKWFHRVTGGLFVSMGVGLLSFKSASQ